MHPQRAANASQAVETARPCSRRRPTPVGRGQVPMRSPDGRCRVRGDVGTRPVHRHNSRRPAATASGSAKPSVAKWVSASTMQYGHQALSTLGIW